MRTRFFIAFLWLLATVSTAQIKQVPLKPSKEFGVSGSKIKGYFGARPKTNPRTVLTVTKKYRGDTLQYYLSDTSTVSYGVFTKDGRLIRTVSQNQNLPPGVHNFPWDGKDDSLRLVENGNYDLKLVISRVKYRAVGVIGNTSTNMEGTDFHKSTTPTVAMFFAGGYVWRIPLYNENVAFMHKFDPAVPQTAITHEVLVGSTRFYAATTDGTTIYWAQSDPDKASAEKKHLIFATKVADNTQVSFTNGIATSNHTGPTFTSAIDTTNSRDGKCRSLAVQTVGNYLFAAFPDRNQIHVIHKTTGSVVQVITGFTRPKALAIQGNTKLWVASDSTLVRQYPINADGTLGTVMASLSGLSHPMAMAVSPDSSLVTVCDGGANQQVKRFNTSDGSSNLVLGDLGGHKVSAAVTNTKFYFDDLISKYQFVCLTHQPDGSFWIGDTGNRRLMHYSANGTFIDKIQFLNKPYTVWTDGTNNNKIYAAYLIYERDFSKPVGPANGSWTLTHNYGQAPASHYGDDDRGFGNPRILSNDETYVRLTSKLIPNSGFELMHLTKTGIMRPTGVTMHKDAQMDLQGNILRITFETIGGKTYQTWRIRTLTGFDGSLNPIYTAETTIAKVPSASVNTANPTADGSYTNPSETTREGYRISFDGTNAEGKYHLGIANTVKEQWWRKGAPSTRNNYYGDFPLDGAMDVGNNVRGTANFCRMLTDKRSMIWGYNGEFWKSNLGAGQANKFNHVHESLLLIGQFGINPNELDGLPENPLGLAGNGFNWGMIQPNADSVYLFQGDEHVHAGITEWLITGLKTIREVNFPISVEFNRVRYATFRSNDLLANLTRDSTLLNYSKGWTRFPVVDDLTNTTSSYWRTITSRRTYRLDDSPDLMVWKQKTPGDFWVKKELPSVTAVNSWTMDVNISSQDNFGGNSNGDIFFQILDDQERIIAQYNYFLIVTTGSPTTIYVNNTALVTNTYSVLKPYLYTFTNLKIYRSGSQVTFKYGPFAPMTVNVLTTGADVSKPRYVRIISNGTSNQKRIMGIKNAYWTYK